MSMSARADGDEAQREQMLRILLDLTADTIVRFDRRLRYDYVNDRTAEVVGRPREQWIGRTQGELGFTPEEVASREARLEGVFASGEPATYLDEAEVIGGSYWFETQLFPQHGADGAVTHVVVVSRDVTARQLAERELVRASERDPLTGLANRLALLRELERAIAAAGRGGRTTGVLLVDLDRFKHVNDSLGHAVGDELLCRAAERLTSSVRTNDLVARHGGDEFVVLMRDLDDPDEAVTLAARLVEAFRAPLLTSAADLFTTASVGIAFAHPSSDQHRDAHDLLREADTAMYVAKDAGRDRFALFDEQLQEAVDERLRIEGQLRRALERQELAVWYQPEIDLVTGELCAVEALLRWHHPSGELYPAGRFIGVAADTGLIVGIGDWVLREACRQAARWAGHRITLRVNLAPRQLEDPMLLERVDTALAGSRLPRDLLCVEITEAALLQDTTVARQNLSGLTDRGVQIAIDDFGTGYASLTYLRRYHVDVIKIDRSFVTDIVSSERDQRLTAAIVALARQLDMTVTAEGVEDADQATVMAALGCHGAQGYLYSPAVPAEDIDRMLTSGV
jgi:diguanylate cyclase (GGDEF)-like protein/PAS domain S-box-containing protein